MLGLQAQTLVKVVKRGYHSPRPKPSPARHFYRLLLVSHSPSPPLLQPTRARGPSPLSGRFVSFPFPLVPVLLHLGRGRAAGSVRTVRGASPACGATSRCCCWCCPAPRHERASAGRAAPVFDGMPRSGRGTRRLSLPPQLYIYTRAALQTPSCVSSCPVCRQQRFLQFPTPSRGVYVCAAAFSALIHFNSSRPGSGEGPSLRVC